MLKRTISKRAAFNNIDIYRSYLIKNLKQSEKGQAIYESVVMKFEHDSKSTKSENHRFKRSRI